MRSDQIIRNARLALIDCEAAARAQGHVGAWVPTMADLEWICLTLGGRKPSADEWRAVGVAWVGGGHVSPPHRGR